MPSPWFIAALGVVALALTATVRVTQTVAPDGWRTADATAVAEDTAAEPADARVQWVTQDGGHVTAPCAGCLEDAAAPHAIAYNPDDPAEFKPIETGEMWLVGAFGAVSALLLLTALVTWSLPPAPVLRPAPRRRRFGFDVDQPHPAA